MIVMVTSNLAVFNATGIIRLYFNVRESEIYANKKMSRTIETKYSDRFEESLC